MPKRATSNDELEIRIADSIAQDFRGVWRVENTPSGEINVFLTTGEVVTLEITEVSYRWK